MSWVRETAEKHAIRKWSNYSSSAKKVPNILVSLDDMYCGVSLLQNWSLFGNIIDDNFVWSAFFYLKEFYLPL